jgi:hypothetical protein
VELRPHRVMIGGQYFAGSFLENELAQSLERYWTVTNWKALKRYKLETPQSLDIHLVAF